MKFACYRSVGEILDIVMKGFDIHNQGIDSKRYERFKKESELSIQEYEEILNITLENIIITLLDSKDKDLKTLFFNDSFKYFMQLLQDFIAYYQRYIRTHESLAASQKQLDFITLIHLFVPFASQVIAFVNTMLNSKTKNPFLFDLILPDSKKYSIAKAFELIVQDLDLEKFVTKIRRDGIETLDSKDILKSILKDLMKDKKGYDTINKNIANWLDCRCENISLDSIKKIAKLSIHCKSFSETKIITLLKIANCLNYLYLKSQKYFCEELSDLLVSHYRLMSFMPYIQMLFLRKSPNAFEDFIEHAYKAKVSPKVYRAIVKMLDEYYYPNVLYHIYKFSEQREEVIQNILKQGEEWICILTHLNEKDFFANIDFFLPIKPFIPKDIHEILKDKDYIIKMNESFCSPDENLAIELKQQEIEQMINKEFSEYAKANQELFLLTIPDREKENGDTEKFLSCLESVKSKYESEFDPFINFTQARFYAQQGELKKSQEHYLNALQYGKGCMGSNYKHVIQEGLIVSAQNTRETKLDFSNAKSPFTKFYKEACLLGLIVSKEEYKTSLLNDIKKQFDLYFNKPFRDKEKESNNGGIIEQKRRAKQAKKAKKNKLLYLSPNFAITDMESLNSIKLDLKNPNKLLKNLYSNPVTQLMHFAYNGNIDAVKKLLERGVDVNIKGECDNATALIFALQAKIIYDINQGKVLEYILKQENIEIAKLLIPLCSKETLHARFVKEKETALSLAIENGLVEIVKLLIKHEIDLEFKTCTKDNMSSLYYCIQCISFAKNISKLLANAKLTKEQILEAMSGNVPTNAIFDEDRLEEWNMLQQMQNTKEGRKMKLDIQKVMQEKYKQNLANYYKIFDLIVENINNVDIIQENLYNFTPLLFATEIGEVGLVKKLLAKGANKNHKNCDGRTAFDYAQKRYDIELMNLLRDKI